MDLVFVRLARVSIDKYTPADKTALFEVSLEDVIGSSSFSKRLLIDSKSSSQILQELVKAEERRSYVPDSKGVKVIVEDYENVSEKLGKFIGRALAFVANLDRHEPKSYLNTLSNIDRMSIEF